MLPKNHTRAAGRLARAMCRATGDPPTFPCPEPCIACHVAATAVASELAVMLRERHGHSTTADWLEAIGSHQPESSTMPNTTILTGETLRIEPLELRHTKIVKSNDMLWAYINWWTQSDNETILDPLPMGEAPNPGPYGNFAPWNRWLGEQLMYAQAKQIRLDPDEVAELIAIANRGARDPESLRAMAVNPPSDD